MSIVFGGMRVKKVYSTAEVCELFQIHKSTLFRWEREGRLPNIPRRAGQRQFSEEHLKMISQLKLEALSRQYANAAKREDLQELEALHPQISWYKLLGGAILGVNELKQMENISDEMIVNLLRVAIDRFSPEDQLFWNIIQAVCYHKERENRDVSPTEE